MIKNLRILTVVVAAMVVIEALLKPTILIWASVDRDSLLALAGPHGTGIDVVLLGFFFLTVIMFAIWIYVAGKNLQAAELDLEYTPGSRIWWFAVPIANLFKPFLAMREMWNASHGAAHSDGNNGLVTGWWVVWIAGNLASYLISRLTGPEAGTNPLWIESAISIVQAGFAIPLILGIARAQGQDLHGGNLDDVFA
jgi:Domain of unknown function (DUF4328)